MTLYKEIIPIYNMNINDSKNKEFLSLHKKEEINLLNKIFGVPLNNCHQLLILISLYLFQDITNNLSNLKNGSGNNYNNFYNNSNLCSNKSPENEKRLRGGITYGRLGR